MIGFLIFILFVSLIVLSYMILVEKKLQDSVILYMGFGLSSTLLYFIFSAPDVALTEAVIGAALSSMVFLITIINTTKKEKIK